MFQLDLVTHEIGHALGFWHEQSRPDRNDYITIDFSNVASSHQHNFQLQPNTVYFGQKYEYGSVMHYAQKVSRFNVN